MSSALEEILEKVRALPPEAKQQLRELLNNDVTDEQTRKAVLIHSMKGKYANLLSSVDEFCAGKNEEIALEDHRSKM